MLASARTVVWLALLSLTLGSQALGQSRSATTKISATVVSSLTISVRSVPIAFEVEDGRGVNQMAVPVEITWNLNPAENRGFEVIGYFSNPDAAVVDRSNGNSIPSRSVLGRFSAQHEFRPFAESNGFGPAAASLMLFRRPISHGDSRGQSRDLLELKIDDSALASADQGTYEGVLYLEARHY